jgi:hypothetical protein
MSRSKAVVANTMTFYWPEGKEVYRLGPATIRAIPHEEGTMLYFDVHTERTPIESLPDTRHHPQPNAEVWVLVKDFDVSRLVGRSFEIPVSYDEEEEDHVSCLCYYDHSDFNQIVVTILGRKGNHFHVRWSGTMDESRPDDGSVPKNRVVIDGMFEFVGAEDES